jgi:DNA-binding transcriptional MocR family regulator
MDAVERIFREDLRPGDRVGIEDPSFPGLIDLVASSGYIPQPFAVDDHGPQPDALRSALDAGARAVVVTPRAQNPVGGAVSTARAAELQRTFRAFPDVLLIENDYAGPVAGAPFQSVRTDTRSRWAVVRSTSKFLGPDLRVAVIAGDDLTVNRVLARQALGPRWVSHILQQLALVLWSDPSYGRRLARASEIYAHRRNAVVAALRQHEVVVTAASGFNLWIPVRDEADTVRALADRGWVVAAGERFRIRSGPGIRVTVATLQPTDAHRFAADVAAALRPRRAAFA